MNNTGSVSRKPQNRRNMDNSDHSSRSKQTPILNTRKESNDVVMCLDELGASNNRFGKRVDKQKIENISNERH